jgi:hypothetical protein
MGMTVRSKIRDQVGRFTFHARPESQSTLAPLIDREAEQLRAVRDRRTSPSELLLLAHDSNPEVRARVTGHPNCPIEAVKRLINDPNPMVRALAAAHPDAPLGYLRALSRDDHDMPRYVATRMLAERGVALEETKELDLSTLLSNLMWP